MPDPVGRLSRPGVRAGLAGAVGGLAVVGAEVWVTPSPTWPMVLDLVAGLALVAAGALLLGDRAPLPGWLLLAAGFAWAATTVGIPGASLTRALIVAAAMTSDLRRTRKAMAIAGCCAAAALVCAWAPVDALGWPWLVVVVLMLAATRSWRGLLVVVPTTALLGLRVLVALDDTLSAAQLDAVVTAYSVTVVMAALGALAAYRVGRPRRNQLVSSVVALAGDGEDDQLRNALASSLRDPGLTVVTREGGRAIESQVLDEDPDLAAAVAEVVRLADANRLLRRDLDAQLEAVRASSARLLTAADRQVEALGARLDQGPIRRLARVGVLLAEITEPSDGAVEERRARAQEHLERALAGLASFGQGGLPDLATTGALQDDLTRLAADLHERSTVVVDAPVLEPVVARTAYFVCAEALSNVAKHAHAEHVWVTVRLVDGRVLVEVADDGRGGADRDGSGLRGISTRVAALGGRLTVTSAKGGGTVVAAEVPA